MRLGSIALLVVGGQNRSAMAQTGKGNDLWKWTTAGDHLKSVVQVSLDGSHGTGVVVRVDTAREKGNGYESHILTAYHVVEPDKDRGAIQVTYRNGTVASECRIVDFDDIRDIALVATWAPKKVQPVAMATLPAQNQMYLEFAGLGGGSNLTSSLRHFSSRATQPTNDDFIYADATLLPGDSGGPVFNKRHELVGIISGGWFWWNGGVTTESGMPLLTTWPARASNVAAIDRMLSRFSEVDVARR